MGMSERPPPTEPATAPAGSADARRRARTAIGLAVLAVTAAAVLGGLLMWLGALSDPRPRTERQDPGRATPSQLPLSAAEAASLLGLPLKLPATAESLNQEAFKICDRLTADIPRRPETYAVAAFIFNRHGRTADAAEVWRRALDVNSRFAPAYCGLGTVLTKKGDYQAAVPLLRQAIALDPDVEPAHRLLADALLHQNQVEEALTVAQEYTRRFPQSADGHYWLGRAYAELGRHEDAKRAGEESVRLDPNYTQAYYSLATVCARLGESERARGYRARFAELKEQDAEVDRQEKKAYEDLLTQQALAASYYLAAGRVYANFGDPRKAEAHWLRGTAIAPKLSECREALVAFYLQHKRPAAALQVLEDLTAAVPDNPAHWISRGRLQSRLNRLDAAEASYRRAVAIAPDELPGYSALIDLALSEQRPLPDLAALAQKAAELAPTAQAYLRLSAVRDRLGDRPGAVAAAQRAVELEPRDQRAHEAYEQLLRDGR